MSAVDAVRATTLRRPAKRGSDRPTCTVCADTMVAAEASAFDREGIVTHLWTCDTCGYGFVTEHRIADEPELA